MKSSGIFNKSNVFTWKLKLLISSVKGTCGYCDVIVELQRLVDGLIRFQKSRVLVLLEK